MSKEVADKFVEALWKLEQKRDVEALVEIHTDDCDVGNVAVPRTFSGHDSLRELPQHLRRHEERIPHRLRRRRRARRPGMEYHRQS
jgi:hypothetical protein